MEIRLTDLSVKDQALWFEGYTWGLDEGRIISERIREEHRHEIQVLWHIIYGFRSDFTLAGKDAKAQKRYASQTRSGWGSL